VPSFPDPTFSTGAGPKAPSHLPAGLNPSSPAFRQAVARCGGGNGRRLSIPG